MPFTLHEATLLDAPHIAELHVATWREPYSHVLPGDFFTADYARGRQQMWKRILGDPEKDWIIRTGKSGGRIVGFAFAGPSFGPGEELPRDRQLFSIYVAAAHYGTGVGQALLDATVGNGPVMLWVAKGNPRAVAFYRRNGFDFDGAERTDPGAPDIIGARMVR